MFNPRTLIRRALAAALCAWALGAHAEQAVDFVGTTSQGLPISLGTGILFDGSGTYTYIYPEYEMGCDNGRRVTGAGVYYGRLTGQGPKRRFSASETSLELRSDLVVSDDGQTVTGSMTVVEAQFANIRENLRDTAKCATGTVSFTATRATPSAR